MNDTKTCSPNLRPYFKLKQCPSYCTRMHAGTVKGQSIVPLGN